LPTNIFDWRQNEEALAHSSYFIYDYLIVIVTAKTFEKDYAAKLKLMPITPTSTMVINKSESSKDINITR